MHNIIENRANIALLITRLIIGGIFIFAGWLKVVDMEMTVSQFAMMKIPAFLAYIVSYGELIGGIFLVLGVWTRFVSLFFLIVMVVAIFLTFGGGFAMFGMPLSMIAGIVAIHGCGTGKYRILKSRCN